ncbi:hypothetical protein [Streptomyces exfoliatus]|uniref:hypothetical protein n=1 Tax=Streptomyces exfoliatus TaxID=1905 RepID=UPI000463CB3C|nr:hypothetical protein [Streptomyces exfoliatus]
MTTTTVARIELAPREKQVLEGLADGSTLVVVAERLRLRDGTARGYLQLAKRKLYGVSENSAALTVAYATGAVLPPQYRDREELYLPRDQMGLIPLIAQGNRATEIAIETKRPLEVVRRDARDLMSALGAKNPAHLVTRAWAYGLLTKELVQPWLQQITEDRLP